jgi:predicted O-linked N-acetylglucosamine transferase (SPINDLY family)
MKFNGDAEILFASAKRLFGQGDYLNAIPVLTRLLRDNRYHVRALTSIGACLFQMGHFRAAKRYFESALLMDSTYSAARLNLGNALYALGDYAIANDEFSAVINDDANNEDAWKGRFECCLALSRHDECHRILLDWPTDMQASEKFVFAKTLLLRREKKNIEALRLLQQAANNVDASAEVYALMAEILLDDYRLDDGLAMVNKAISLQPESILYWCMRANIFFSMSDLKQCSEAFSKATSLCPQSAALFLNQNLLFPVIPASTQQIQDCRVKFIDGLVKAESAPELTLIYQHPCSLHTFTLAYHNSNDLELLVRYNSLMRKLATPLLSELETIKHRRLSSVNSPAPRVERIRIGFMSRYFYGHSNTMAFQGLIRLLDRNRFEIILIHVFGSREDNVRSELNSLVDEVVDLPNDLEAIYLKLHELNLNILYFTDLGMSPYDFLYPLFRSAPIQITGWGIPHTSGNDSLDYYISAAGIEPDGAEALYSEKLVKLPGGLPCCFYTDSLDTPELGREYFFLPNHCKLIGCLQSLHKLHPDFDHLLEAIATQNPDSILVFVEDSYSISTELFLKRLTSSAPTAKDQIIVLKKMVREEYQALTKCMDLLLDPIYYGSGITFFEAVLAGTPIVTLEGDFLRSRVVASGYREMGIYSAPIATSTQEYIQIVHELLDNDGQRESLRKQIHSQRHRVVNRADYVRSFEEFCLEVTGRNP